MCGICGCADQHEQSLHLEFDAAARDVPSLGTSEAAHEQRRTLLIERAILSHNDDQAAANRARFAQAGWLALNLLSSPGSGKTSLLAATIKRLQGQLPCAVIEGDQETSFDADRIKQAGAPAVQINTGRGCHLDAAMISGAVDQLLTQSAGLDPDAAESGILESGAVLFIENVGNLVCPAAFDLGEAARVVLLSVTEGDDKPMKYPDMFAVADLLIINKVDLAPFVQFDIARCIDFARRINPAVEVISLSATTGAGMDGWMTWITQRRHRLTSSTSVPSGG